MLRSLELAIGSTAPLNSKSFEDLGRSLARPCRTGPAPRPRTRGEVASDARAWLDERDTARLELDRLRDPASASLIELSMAADAHAAAVAEAERRAAFAADRYDELIAEFRGFDPLAVHPPLVVETASS